MPASLTWSSGLRGFSVPGRLGAGFSASGIGGAGSFIGSPLRGREAAGVQELADAVEVLARIAVRREALELAVDGVARADLELAVADARVEAVQRAHRRAPAPPAPGDVHTARARAE